MRKAATREALARGDSIATDTNLELTNDDLRAHANARSMAEARKAEARRMGPRRRPPAPPPQR